MPIRSIFFTFMVLLSLYASAVGQDSAAETTTRMPLLMPETSLDLLQAEHSDHSPLLVSQEELDGLIQRDGGGACPIAAGLIAVQTLRSMTGFPLDVHPHRTALRLFQEKPELKEGRISNKQNKNRKTEGKKKKGGGGGGGGKTS